MTLSSTLFHYTSTKSWEKIRASGYIDTTSQAARHLDGQSPHVWLTDGPGHDSGLRDPDRTVVRISLAPPRPSSTGRYGASCATTGPPWSKPEATQQPGTYPISPSQPSTGAR
ncbi:hypothetical protein [Streptomyces sp. NPDC048665]|uniref:hypothetical protein n=1 Tax=Streptomyces sp. NPDC048665 TaxID=3155490 RepID=UPI003430FC10